MLNRKTRVTPRYMLKYILNDGSAALSVILVNVIFKISLLTEVAIKRSVLTCNHLRNCTLFGYSPMAPFTFEYGCTYSARIYSKHFTYIDGLGWYIELFVTFFQFACHEFCSDLRKKVSIVLN